MPASRRAVLQAYAAASALLLLVAGAWTALDERRKVAEARQAVERLSEMQESYYKLNGEYTDNISRLAQMTTSWFGFMDAMETVIDFRAGFVMTPGPRGFTIVAHARDLRRTEIVVDGPRPKRRL